MSPRLLHTGNAVVDLVLQIPALPPRGGDVMARSSARYPGGGVNVMVAAARQGLSVVYAGAHGTGPNGDLIRAALAADGVTCALVPRPDQDTGLSIALVDGEGERTFATIRGAEAHLAVADLAGVAVRPDDWVYVTGYSLTHDANREALLAWLPALPASVSVVFDPGPLVGSLPAAVRSAVLDRTDWCSANEREALALAGTDEVTAAGAWLVDRVRRGAIVRLGASGCLVATAAGSVRVPGVRVDAVDLNGAGDAHVGAFVAALARGANPVDAARRANAAAAYAVTRRGPATAPTSRELDAFIARRF